MSYYNKPKKRLYRSRHGMFFGVCLGISDYFSLPVFWIRVLMVLFFFISGFFPLVFIYILAGLIMKKEPAGPDHSWCDGHDYYESGKNDMYSENLKERLTHLKKKIRDMESNMSYREYRWNRKFNGL